MGLATVTSWTPQNTDVIKDQTRDTERETEEESRDQLRWKEMKEERWQSAC